LLTIILVGQVAHSQIGIHAHLSMMAQPTRGKQVSSVALLIFQLGQFKRLQRRKNIFAIRRSKKERTVLSPKTKAASSGGGLLLFGRERVT
jgi:hypothetical protein